jgi:hypothetical protein
MFKNGFTEHTVVSLMDAVQRDPPPPQFDTKWIGKIDSFLNLFESKSEDNDLIIALNNLNDSQVENVNSYFEKFIEFHKLETNKKKALSIAEKKNEKQLIQSNYTVTYEDMPFPTTDDNMDQLKQYMLKSDRNEKTLEDNQKVVQNNSIQFMWYAYHVMEHMINQLLTNNKSLNHTEAKKFLMNEYKDDLVKENPDLNSIEIVKLVEKRRKRISRGYRLDDLCNILGIELQTLSTCDFLSKFYDLGILVKDAVILKLKHELKFNLKTIESSEFMMVDGKAVPLSLTVSNEPIEIFFYFQDDSLKNVIKIKASELNVLQPEKWLNDVIIDIWLM